MKSGSSRKQMRRGVLLAGLLAGLLGGAEAWAWTDAVKDAANAVANGTKSPDAQRINFENNQAINRMGARGTKYGGIDSKTYKASQNAFTAKNNQIIMESAEACGLKVDIKPPKIDPKTGEPSPLAGTDTDVNVTTKDGKPLTHEQWKKLNDTYNQKVNDYLQKPPGSKVNTGTDLMPDPKTTSPEDFQKICNDINKQGGTTYKDPAAARVEGAMANGEPLVVNETGNYVTELQNQANSHFNEAAKTTSQANELAKVYGENSTQVQDLRAKAQIENSQGAKYIEKIEKVTDTVAKQAGLKPVPADGKPPPSEGLIKDLYKDRGADTIPQSEMIGPLGKNAINNATEGFIKNMAELAKSNPQAAPACQDAIAQSMRDLPMSQKGQAMDMLKTNYGDDFAKGVAKSAQGPGMTPGASVMKGFEKVMKVVGPGLMVIDGYHRIKGVLNAPDEAKTYEGGKAIGGFIGGMGVGAAVGLGVAGILGAPVTAVGAAVVIGAGLVAGAAGYTVGDYAGSSLAGWMLEGVRPRDQKEYDALAAKGLLDGSKDIYGQLVGAGVDPRVAQAAANAYKNGDVKTFREILAAVRNVLVKDAKKMEPRRFADVPTNEVQQLLDCLCSQSLGANPWVMQGYFPKPSDASPSCIDPANGPCMASGFGCWRSFIRWQNKGISDCLASFNVVDNLNTRMGIDSFNAAVEKPLDGDIEVDRKEVCPGDVINVTCHPRGARGNYNMTYKLKQQVTIYGSDFSASFIPSAISSEADWLGTMYNARTNSTSAQITVAPSWDTKTKEIPCKLYVILEGESVGPYTQTRIATCVKAVDLKIKSREECEGKEEAKKEEAKKEEAKKKEPKKETAKKPPPKKTVKKGGARGLPGDQINAPDGYEETETETEESGGTVAGTPATHGTKPTSKETPKTTKGATTTQPPSGGHGPSGPKGPGEGPDQGVPATGQPKGGVSEGGGEGPVPGDECSFGGGATAIDNGPVNMWVEVPSNERVRVTITGSDGFTKTIEGVGRVDIVRPRNPSGTDTIIMENLDKPACRDQQVAQYDTNGIPGGMPVAPTNDLGQAEPAMPEYPDGTVIIDTDQMGVGAFIGDKESAAGERTGQGFDNMDLNTGLANGANAGNQQVNEAKSTLDQGGAVAQDTKEKTAKETAKSDADSSWGRTLGEAVVTGVTEGGKKFGEAIGGAAADQAGGAIFGTTKTGGKGEVGEGGEGESAQGPTSSGASSGGSGGGSGGGYGGGADEGAGGAATPTSGNLPGGSESGSGGVGAPDAGVDSGSGGAPAGTVTCDFCGHVEVVPAGGQPAPNCPVCGCGPGMDMVSCSVCGHRWLVPSTGGPPTGGCPKCGNGGKVTEDTSDSGVGGIAAPAGPGMIR